MMTIVIFFFFSSKEKKKEGNHNKLSLPFLQQHTIEKNDGNALS
jgi:hypothetical protein